MDTNLMRYLTADMQAGIDDQRMWSGEICPECGSSDLLCKVAFGRNPRRWLYQCWDCETQFYVDEADRKA